MLITFLVILTLTVLYWFPVRRWFRRWGTTDEDLRRVMAGDPLIANPTHSATHGLTVDAPPEDIWPWLVQMGYRRGGLYSYDWLDRLFGYLDRPSESRPSRVSAVGGGRRDSPWTRQGVPSDGD